MENQIKNQKVETLTGDIAKALEGNKDGLIKKLIHEQEEKEHEGRKNSPQARKNKWFAVGSLILFITAAVIILAFYNLKKGIDVAPPGKQFQSLIYTDKTEFKEIGGLSKDEIVNSIVNLTRTARIKAEGVGGVYLTDNKKIIGLRKFTTLIEGHFMPESEIEVSDSFMFGIKNTGEQINTPTGATTALGGDLFILLKTRSFEDIFYPMRSWESDMFSDLHDLFGVKLAQNTKYLMTKSFEDTVIDNRNARVLYDQVGNIVLAYVFADNSSVIIAKSEQALSEVIVRLNVDQTKK